MQTALSLMQYLGEVDPLARRYSQILAAFHAAISRKETVAAKDRLTATRASSDDIFNAFFGGSGGAEIGTAAAQPPNPGSAPLDFRRSSNSNIAPSTNMNNASVISAIQTATDWQPTYWRSSSLQSDPKAGAGVTAKEGGPGLIATGTGSGISPGDYCLDFDAFLNSVGLGAGGSESVGPSQDMYGAGSWMPLYGTMDIG